MRTISKLFAVALMVRSNGQSTPLSLWWQSRMPVVRGPWVLLVRTRAARLDALSLSNL